MTPRLTSRQRDILDYIIGCFVAWGHAPTIREIAAHFGISSPNGVTSHLKALERKGCLAPGRHALPIVPTVIRDHLAKLVGTIRRPPSPKDRRHV